MSESDTTELDKRDKRQERQWTRNAAIATVIFSAFGMFAGLVKAYILTPYEVDNLKARVAQVERAATTDHEILMRLDTHVQDIWETLGGKQRRANDNKQKETNE